MFVKQADNLLVMIFPDLKILHDFTLKFSTSIQRVASGEVKTPCIFVYKHPEVPAQLAEAFAERCWEEYTKGKI